MNKRAGIIISLIILLLLAACSPEEKLCAKFISSKDTLNVLLLKSDFLFKKNLKINSDSIPEQMRDSVSLARSQLIKKISGRTLIDLLFSNMSDELKKEKLRVFAEDSLVAFMKRDTGSYIFHLAQSELDEFYDYDTVAQEINDLTYFQDLVLNAVSINLWFEVMQQNSEQDHGQTLFSSEFINDKVDGSFKRNFITGEVGYYYKRSDITADDVYTMAADFGAKNAHYIFDYFMNEYVHANYKGKKPLRYMHYDPASHMVYPATYNRFIFM